MGFCNYFSSSRFVSLAAPSLMMEMTLWTPSFGARKRLREEPPPPGSQNPYFYWKRGDNGVWHRAVGYLGGSDAESSSDSE